MTCGDAMYWTRKLMREVQIELSNQDVLDDNERRLLKDLIETDLQMARIEDLVDWLETSGYIREEI